MTFWREHGAGSPRTRRAGGLPQRVVSTPPHGGREAIERRRFRPHLPLPRDTEDRRPPAPRRTPEDYAGEGGGAGPALRSGQHRPAKYKLTSSPGASSRSAGRDAAPARQAGQMLEGVAGQGATRRRRRDPGCWSSWGDGCRWTSARRTGAMTDAVRPGLFIKIVTSPKDWRHHPASDRCVSSATRGVQ